VFAKIAAVFMVVTVAFLAAGGAAPVRSLGGDVATPDAHHDCGKSTEDSDKRTNQKCDTDAACAFQCGFGPMMSAQPPVKVADACYPIEQALADMGVPPSASIAPPYRPPRLPPLV
jgi:hypothetical protein